MPLNISFLNARHYLAASVNQRQQAYTSYDRLISTMGFSILVRWHLYIESGPWSLFYQGLSKALADEICTYVTTYIILIYIFSFQKMHLKMVSTKGQPFCFSLNMVSVLMGFPHHASVMSLMENIDHFMHWSQCLAPCSVITRRGHTQ